MPAYFDSCIFVFFFFFANIYKFVNIIFDFTDKEGEKVDKNLYNDNNWDNNFNKKEILISENKC